MTKSLGVRRMHTRATTAAAEAPRPTRAKKLPKRLEVRVFLLGMQPSLRFNLATMVTEYVEHVRCFLAAISGRRLRTFSLTRVHHEPVRREFFTCPLDMFCLYCKKFSLVN